MRLPALIISLLAVFFLNSPSFSIQASFPKKISEKLKNDSLVNDTTKIIYSGFNFTNENPFIGSASKVFGNDLLKAPTTNFTHILAGQIPGLTVLTNDGEPGNDKSTLLIHGVNTFYVSEPLIVVDGIPNRSIERLETSDIESIILLKDANAAIYGGRAANGVLLVTTKHGILGRPQITLNFNQGISQPTVIPRMANSATYATMLNEIDSYRGGSPRYSKEDIQKFENGSDPLKYPNTDWFDTVLKKYSVQNSFNASLTGGTRKFRYYGSAGTMYQDGIYKNSALNYRQNNARLNLDGNLGKSIQIGFYLNFRQEISNMPTHSTSTIFRSIMRARPDKTAFWYDGKPNSDFEFGENPAIITTNETGTNKQTSSAIESAIRIKIDVPFISGLSINSNVAFDRETKKHRIFEKPWYLYSWNGISYDTSGLPALTENKVGLFFPRLSIDNYELTQITWNLSANYHKVIENKHFMDVTIESTKNINNDRHDYDYLSYKANELIDSTTIQYGKLKSDYSFTNYYGQFNYSYLQKYFIGLTVGRSISPYLPSKSNQRLFPAISAAWLISEENFLKNQFSFLNRLKLFGSYGKTGTDYLLAKGLNNNSMANPDISWELSTQSAIGFETQILNNTFSLDVNYFYNHRIDIPMIRNSSAGGMNLPLENMGKVINRGVDYALNYQNKIGEFNILISMNGSYQKNKVEFIDEASGLPDYQKLTGKQFSQLYYHSLGVFKNQAEIDAYPHWNGARPGDIIFADINDDKKIDGLDRVRTDKSDYPVFTGGLKFLIAYKHLDLALLFQGSIGTVKYIPSESGINGNYYKEFADNRWTPENTNTLYPRAWNTSETHWTSQNNTYWLRNADFLRLKFLEIGYNFKSKVIKPIKDKEMRVYFNGFNLITFDKLKILDPESTNAYSYPISQIFNLGVKCSF